jgi:hypothetical protein
LPLARSLSCKGISLVGTIRQNRKEIPAHFKENGLKKELYHSMALHTDCAMLTLYKAKKNKVIFLLSTLHQKHAIPSPESNPKKKPEVVQFYNETKGGVDKADQMLRQYSCKAATRRWPLAAFYNMIDIACLNTFVICDESGITHCTRRDFLISLSRRLCEPLVLSRAQTSNIQRVLSNIRHIMPMLPCQDASADGEIKRTTCRLCQINKTRTSCLCCEKFVCGTCSKVLCNQCVSQI